MLDAERVTFFEVFHESEEILVRISKDKDFEGSALDMNSGIVGHVANSVTEFSLLSLIE